MLWMQFLLPTRTTCDQNFSPIRRCWLELLLPKTQKCFKMGREPKKTSWFFLAKVKNGKYPKAETWHPNSIDGDGPIRGYVRICEWPFDSWWQFGPKFGPSKIFWLNFPKILWFFWDLGHVLLIILKGAEILVLSNIFDFSAVN